MAEQAIKQWTERQWIDFFILQLRKDSDNAKDIWNEETRH